MSITIKTLLCTQHMPNTKQMDKTRDIKSQKNIRNSQTNIQLGFDRVTISSTGIIRSNVNISTKKLNPQLDTLYKQKENLIERKNSIISKMLEQGRSPDSISEDVKEIDEMLKDIESQISKVQLEEQQKCMGLDKDSQKKKADSHSPNNTTNASSNKNSMFTNTMNTIISSDCDLEQIECLDAVKTNSTGELRVLRKEIELDESRSLQGKSSEFKYKSRDDLEQKLQTLTEYIAEKISDTHEKLNENENNEPTNETSSENFVEIKNSENSDPKNTDDIKGSHDHP